jgi:hypothetical protein
MMAKPEKLEPTRSGRAGAGRRGLRRRAAAQAALVLGLVIVLAAFDGGAPLRAEGLWCASVTGPDGGFVNCGYSSWRQCQAALSGQGGICHLAPTSASGHRAARPRQEIRNR